jgi:transcriptional regulator with XRE-family HTH domain
MLADFKLQSLRLKSGMTYREIAEAGHLNRSTVADAFEGRRRPTLGSLRIICRVLGIELAEVIVVEQRR